MRYLGVDPGRKRIGLAISDPGGRVASPLSVLQRKSLGQVVSEVAERCRAEDVGGIVVGLPLNMNGSKGRTATNAEQLAEALRKETGLPVELWDERLSSVAAERSMVAGDLPRAKRKKVIDKVAAQVILQSFLDAQSECGK